MDKMCKWWLEKFSNGAFKRFIKDRDGRHLFALEVALLVLISNYGQAWGIGRKNIAFK
jgi:hypothetical protein